MRRNTVLRKYAFHLFTQYKFKESLENYLKIKEGRSCDVSCDMSCDVLIRTFSVDSAPFPADPEVVIGLYPHLLPSDRRRMVNQSQPTRPPTLSGEHLEEGMNHLITYLTQVSPPHTITLSHYHFITPSPYHTRMYGFRCVTGSNRRYSGTRRGNRS